MGKVADKYFAAIYSDGSMGDVSRDMHNVPTDATKIVEVDLRIAKPDETPTHYGWCQREDDGKLREIYWPLVFSCIYKFRMAVEIVRGLNTEGGAVVGLIISRRRWPS